MRASELGRARATLTGLFDELILALDLYLRWRPSQPPADHADLQELSELLQQLPIHPVGLRSEDFRNTNGVRRKLGDFTAPDPQYDGKATKGGIGVHRVWERFANDPDGLAEAVGQITATATGAAPTLPPEEDEEGVIEGRIVFRQHRDRERDASLVRRKKAEVLERAGALACEACAFDFSERYGDLGQGFIECHHTLPLADAAERVTRLADLALVCSNCHRMIHRGGRMLTVEELRELLQG